MPAGPVATTSCTGADRTSWGAMSSRSRVRKVDTSWAGGTPSAKAMSVRLAVTPTTMRWREPLTRGNSMSG